MEKERIMGDNSFLKISGIKKSFGSGENRTEVLRGIDFEVAKGELDRKSVV